MAYRTLAASIALVIGTSSLAPCAAQAAGTSHEIKITGARTASVDVTLRSTVHINYKAATFETHGDFVGFYAEAIDKAVAKRTEPGNYLGAVRLRRFGAPDEPDGAVIGLTSTGDNWLAAGRYRFYLMTDGQGTVHLPIDGNVSYVLAPTRATTAQVAAAPNILVTPLNASNRQPLQVRGVRSVSISAILVGKFRLYAGEIEACLAAVGKGCGSATADSSDGAYTGEVINAFNDVSFAWILLYQPGLLPAGAFEAVQSAVNAGTLQYAAGCAFTLQLT